MFVKFPGHIFIHWLSICSSDVHCWPIPSATNLYFVNTLVSMSVLLKEIKHLYVRVKYREGGIYGVYSPRGRAASEGCIRHKSRVSRYLTNLFYFWGGFVVESFDFKQFKSKFVEIFPQVWSNYLFNYWDTARGTSKKTDTKIK